jgi:hypothetical protein
MLRLAIDNDRPEQRARDTSCVRGGPARLASAMDRPPCPNWAPGTSHAAGLRCRYRRSSYRHRSWPCLMVLTETVGYANVCDNCWRVLQTGSNTLLSADLLVRLRRSVGPIRGSCRSSWFTPYASGRLDSFDQEARRKGFAQICDTTRFQS